MDEKWSVCWDNEAGPGWDWLIIVPGYENITGLCEALARRIVADHNAALSGEDGEYWNGYLDAIKHVDALLRKRGDDQTIRSCRQAVLALVKIPYEPAHAIPREPDWAKAQLAVEDGK